MKSFLVILALIFFSFTCATAQKPKKAIKKLGENPVFVLDSVEIDNSVIQATDPKSIASVTMYYDEEATQLFGDRGKDGVVFIETKNFAVKRYTTFFRKHSPQYDSLISNNVDDSNFQYILNDRVLTENFEGDLAIIDSEIFIDLKIISKKELNKKYKEIDDKKELGILIRSKIPPHLYKGKKKF